MAIIVDPSHIEAIKWAAKAVRATDRQPIDGVYLLQGPEGVLWVGMTLWRILGCHIPHVDSRTQWDRDPVDDMWSMRYLSHQKTPDPDGGKPFPSEVVDLLGVLGDDQRAEFELNVPPDDQLSAHIRALHQRLELAREVGGPHIELPGVRWPGWRDDEGKYVDYVVREDDATYTLGSEHVVPFKGKTITQIAPHVWGFRENHRWGVIAERKRKDDNVQDQG